MVLLLPLLLVSCAPQAPPGSPTVTASLLPYHSATPPRTPTPPSLAAATEDSLRPTPTPFVHEVLEGETLLSIALQYGVGLDEMLAANPGIDPRFLSIGQTLRIPGPEGEPVDTLLPTATPLPIEVGAGECYPSPAGALICLATVSNPTDQPVEGISARVQLLDGSGQILANDLAFTPLNRLPPGSSLPLTVQFPAGTTEPAAARFSLLSAVGSTAAEERYVEVEISELTTTAGPQGLSWRVQAELDLEEALAGAHPFMVAQGYSAEGQLVGYVKWEPTEGDDPPYQVELVVFSLGPSIERVEVLAEALRPPAE